MNDDFNNNNEGHSINVPHDNVIESARISDNYREEDDIRRDFTGMEDLHAPQSVNINKKAGPIKTILTIVVVLLVAWGIIATFNPLGLNDILTSNIEKIKSDPVFNFSTKMEENTNGIYKYETYSAYIYGLNGDTLFFYITDSVSKTSASGTAKYEKNVAKYEKDGVKIELELKGRDLIVRSSTNKVASATYEYDGDVTKEKCFMLDYNATKFYLDSKYNGKYKHGEVTINLFQVRDNEVNVYVSSGNDLRGIILEIQSDGTLRTPTYSEELYHEKMIITVSNVGLDVKHSSMNYLEITGNYPFDRKLDVTDILLKDFK